MKRTPAHVTRISPELDRYCIELVVETEFNRGAIAALTADTTSIPTFSNLMPPPVQVDEGFLIEIGEMCRRIAGTCPMRTEAAIDTGLAYQNFAESLVRGKSVRGKVALTVSEEEELGRHSDNFIKAFLNDMLEVDTGEGYEQPGLGA